MFYGVNHFSSHLPYNSAFAAIAHKSPFSTLTPQSPDDPPFLVYQPTNVWVAVSLITGIQLTIEPYSTPVLGAGVDTPAILGLNVIKYLLLLNTGYNTKSNVVDNGKSCAYL